MKNFPHPNLIPKNFIPRIQISTEAEQIWRFASHKDLLQEEAATKDFPSSLQQWIPQARSNIQPVNDVYCRAEENMGERVHSPLEQVQQWQEACHPFWRAESLQEKTLQKWLKSLQPACKLDIGSIKKQWKKEAKKLPFNPKHCNLRKILDQKIVCQLHRGYVHGALIPRRIRKKGFICWRNASTDGLRGTDEAPFLSPYQQPVDIQLHILKWSWKNDPIQLAHCLVAMNLVKAPITETFLQYSSYHPALKKEQLRKILGCDEGFVPVKIAQRALYRANKLQLGDQPIVLQTKPVLSPKKDVHFFLPRKRERTHLFSRWHQGIQVDEQGLYSITPEKEARSIAVQVTTKHNIQVLLDAFAGCGGNTIAFAKEKSIARVLSFEYHPTRYKMLEHNAKLYGVDHKIRFHQDDAMTILPPADFVFLDPPWVWGHHRLSETLFFFQEKYNHGMIKLPVQFPFPTTADVQLVLTAENYPSFALLSW